MGTVLVSFFFPVFNLRGSGLHGSVVQSDLYDSRAQILHVAVHCDVIWFMRAFVTCFFFIRRAPCSSRWSACVEPHFLRRLWSTCRRIPPSTGQRATMKTHQIKENKGMHIFFSFSFFSFNIFIFYFFADI